MRLKAVVALFSIGALPVIIGCNGNTQLWPTQNPPWNQQNIPPLVSQMQDLGRRNRELETDNQDLHSKLALDDQQRQILRDELTAIRKQMSETVALLESERLANSEAQKKIQTMQASTRARGGATITANSNVKNSVKPIDIPGLEVRQDGDAVRISIPADQLFTSGGISASAAGVLDRVADTIVRQFPRQKIAVEGYTDNSANLGQFAHAHQLANAEAMAVLDHLLRKSRIPATQLLAVAHGSNHPVVSNATPTGRSKNRRVEIVIYPETVDGN